MTAPLTRREALAAGLCTAGLLGRAASAAPVPKADDNKSWVGKTVLPKRPDPPGAFPVANPGGEPLEGFRTLGGASWEVKAEKGTRVQVLDGDGTACWVEKELLVPLADAVEFYTKALKDNSNDAYAHNFRGWAKYLLGKPDEAVKDFDEFLRLVPADGVARRVGLSNRGLVLAEQGNFDPALKDLDEAVRLNHLPALLNRGWAYELKGDYKKALADYDAVLAARSNDALGLNNLAWLKATCPDAALRDGKEAVRLARKVCELTGDREGMYLDTLAAAHAEAGDFAAAVKAQEKALEDKGYARKQGDDAQKRLQLYKDKKPYRTTPLKAK